MGTALGPPIHTRIIDRTDQLRPLLALGPITGLRQPITCRAPCDVSATVIDRFALTRCSAPVQHGGLFEGCGGEYIGWAGCKGGYSSKWVFHENQIEVDMIETI